MKIVRYVSLSLMLIAGLGSIQAQQKTMVKKAPEKAEKVDVKTVDHDAKWQKEMNLTPEQTAKIKEIRAKRADEQSKLQSELQNLRKAEREEIRAVYTPEQRTKMEQMRNERKEKMKSHEGKRKMRSNKMRPERRK